MALKKTKFVVAALQLSASFLCRAEIQRYVVKVRTNAASLGAPRLDFKARREEITKSLAQEIPLAIPSKVQVSDVSRFGLLFIQGEATDVEALLKEHPSVAYFEKDRRWHLSDVTKSTTPDSPASLDLAPWMSDILGLNAVSPDPGVVNPATNSVVVAVVDTGLTLNHPDFDVGVMNSADALTGANVIDDDSDVSETNTDHGTHVSGLVKAVRDQAITLYPQAASVQILPIRFIGDEEGGTTSSAILGLDYAVSHHARVINASWGAGGAAAFSQALYDSMVELYQDDDIVFAVAAGNADVNGPNNNDLIPYFPSSFNIPSLLSVASLTAYYYSEGSGNSQLSETALSDFSNYGAQSVHLAAPGDYQNAELSSPGLWSANAHFSSNSDLYIQMRGTSMSTPLVAGVAAVIRAINPSLTSFEVKQLILNTVHKTSTLSMISSSGWLDAAKAFQAASTAVTQGLRPAVPSNPYTIQNQATTDPSAGGCASVSGAGANSSGPWGGNSLGLFSAVYILAVILKHFRAKPGKKHSV